MSKTRRIFSILMTAVFFVSMLPAMTSSADNGTILYQREYLEHPVFNIKAGGAPTLFMESNGNSVFNAINRFTKKHGPGQPDTLSFSGCTSGSIYNAWYSLEYNTPESMLAQKGDLGVAYSANLTNDRHWDFVNHYAIWIMSRRL